MTNRSVGPSVAEIRTILERGDPMTFIDSRNPIAWASSKIIAADVHDSRLKLAEEFGAAHGINSKASDIVDGVRKITGSTVDFAFDCMGVIPVIEQVAEAVGMLVLIGGAPAHARFSLDHLRTLSGKRVIGVLGGGERIAELMPARGSVPTGPLSYSTVWSATRRCATSIRHSPTRSAGEVVK